MLEGDMIKNMCWTMTVLLCKKCFFATVFLYHVLCTEFISFFAAKTVQFSRPFRTFFVFFATASRSFRMFVQQQQTTDNVHQF